MTVSYFPGCTLKNKAVDLDKYARQTAEKLGVTFEELDEWQCCGGVFTESTDEIATKLSSVRALKKAEDLGNILVTVCSACHNVIKQTNYQMSDEDFASKVNNYLGSEEAYDGQAVEKHYLELLRDDIGFDSVKKQVVNPLKGKKIACYYGCLLLRPSKVMKTDDPENPSIMEDLVKSLGAEPVYYAARNECCGGYVVADSPEFSKRRAKDICDGAEEAGADMIVTACPLCMYNLKKSGSDIPVVYFTEVMAEAFGIKEGENNG